MSAVKYFMTVPYENIVKDVKQYFVLYGKCLKLKRQYRQRRKDFDVLLDNWYKIPDKDKKCCDEVFSELFGNNKTISCCLFFDSLGLCQDKVCKFSMLNKNYQDLVNAYYRLKNKRQDFWTQKFEKVK